MMENIISVKELSRTFDDIKAVDDISFNVKHNEMFGFAGPDGAGKTTTIRILCGLLNADSGNVTILGENIKENSREIKDNIGYLSQKFSLYTDLTVDENIQFFAEIHGVKDHKNRRNELLELMRLINFRKFLAGNLSGGMKQKLALACTLIHKPKIIFLDEPTTGVDPVSRRDFWKILSELIKENITIVVSTPYMDEAERFNRLLLMDKGKILSRGTPDELKKNFNYKILEVVSGDSRKAGKLLKEKTNLDVQMFGDRLNIIMQNDDDNNLAEEILNKEKIHITDIRFKSPNLENVFIKLMS